MRFAGHASPLFVAVMVQMLYMEYIKLNMLPLVPLYLYLAASDLSGFLIPKLESIAKPWHDQTS